jgi:hypothetical protein
MPLLAPVTSTIRPSALTEPRLAERDAHPPAETRSTLSALRRTSAPQNGPRFQRFLENAFVYINVYLESHAFGRFSIGYGLIGPTEVRLILIALNTVVALGAGLDFVVADLELTVFDLIGLAIAATMIVLLVGRAARNLRELGRKEPGAPRG